MCISFPTVVPGLQAEHVCSMGMQGGIVDQAKTEESALETLWLVSALCSPAECSMLINLLWNLTSASQAGLLQVCRAPPKSSAWAQRIRRCWICCAASTSAHHVPGTLRSHWLPTAWPDTIDHVSHYPLCHQKTCRDKAVLFA